MTSIDRSKAPEGYDFRINWGDLSSGVDSGFYADKGDRFTKENGNYTPKESIGEFPGLEVTKRPSAWGEYTAGETAPANPAEWTGEDGSLPPVRTVCQVHRDGTEWVEVQILAHFRNSAAMVAAFIPTADGGKFVSQAIAACFRPIRTAEQIAAEEREKAVHGMLVHMRGPDRTPVDLAMSLYDAGYRK